MEPQEYENAFGAFIYSIMKILIVTDIYIVWTRSKKAMDSK